MDSVGYWVLEWPISSRRGLENCKALQTMKIRVRRIFRDQLGYERVLIRWHLFGTEDRDVQRAKFNPHLNILVDGRFIIKHVLRKRLKEPRLIVNYSYRSSVREMLHTLKYVTRPTFLNEKWNPILARELRGMHFGDVWGGQGVWGREGGEWIVPPMWGIGKRR